MEKNMERQRWRMIFRPATDWRRSRITLCSICSRAYYRQTWKEATESSSQTGRLCKYGRTKIPVRTQQLLAQVPRYHIPTGQQVPKTLCMRPVHCGELPWRDHAFTHRMQQTLELIQALSRSAVDKTTTATHNFDKALDISNIRFQHQQFEFPIIFISMAPSLAKLLSDHPSLPLQGATGLLPIVSNALMKYHINPSDYGKGGKSKGKLNNEGSGKSTGKGKLSNKGKAHSDRTPDQTYSLWKKVGWQSWLLRMRPLDPRISTAPNGRVHVEIYRQIFCSIW